MKPEDKNGEQEKVVLPKPEAIQNILDQLRASFDIPAEETPFPEVMKVAHPPEQSAEEPIEESADESVEESADGSDDESADESVEESVEEPEEALFEELENPYFVKRKRYTSSRRHIPPVSFPPIEEPLPKESEFVSVSHEEIAEALIQEINSSAVEISLFESLPMEESESPSSTVVTVTYEGGSRDTQKKEIGSPFSLIDSVLFPEKGEENAYQNRSLEERLSELRRFHDEHLYGSETAETSPESTETEISLADESSLPITAQESLTPDEESLQEEAPAPSPPTEESFSVASIMEEAKQVFLNESSAPVVENDGQEASMQESSEDAPIEEALNDAKEESTPFASSPASPESPEQLFAVPTEEENGASEESSSDEPLPQWERLEDLKEPASSPVEEEPALDRVIPPAHNATLETSVLFAAGAVSMPDMKVERETLSLDTALTEIPEDVVSHEPFNSDDYVINDRSVGEEMAAGESTREYVTHVQNEDILHGFRKRIRVETVRLILISFLATLLLITENVGILFGWQLPAFGDDLGIQGLPVLLNLQMLLLIAVLALPQLRRGIEVFRTRKFYPETNVVFLLLFSMVYDIVLYATGTVGAPFFGFCAALYVAVIAAFDFLKINDEYMTFQVVSSTARKHVAVTASIGNYPEESMAMRGIVDYDEAALSETRRAGFVEGFFARSNMREGDRMGAFIFIVAVFFAFIALLASVLFQGKDAAEGIYAFVVSFAAVTPLSAIFVRQYPFGAAVRKTALSDAAIVGEYSATEYASTEVFVMQDTDIFPSKNVKLKGIKLFGDNRLDRVLHQVSSLFQYTGGPLCGVFGSVGGGMPEIEEIVLHEVSDNGILAKMNGNTLLVGDGAFMEQHHVTVFYDSEDTRQMESGKINIMYVAENGSLSARFYLQYIPDARFERTVERLAKENVAVLIRTFDPNVSERLIQKVSYISALPVRVVRKRISSLTETKKPRLGSGIVTTGSPTVLFEILMRCIRLERILQSDNLVKLFNAGVGLVAMLFLLILNGIGFTCSLWVALFQAFWFLPVLAVTKIYLRE